MSNFDEKEKSKRTSLKETMHSQYYTATKDIKWEDIPNSELLTNVRKAKDIGEIEVTWSNANGQEEKFVKAGTEAMQDYFKTPYSYSQAASELQRRGARNEWYFPKENLQEIVIPQSRIKNAVEVRWHIDSQIHEALMEYLQDFPKTEVPKIVGEILKRGFEDLLEQKRKGKKTVKYPDVTDRYL